jgi:hypothetical protein
MNIKNTIIGLTALVAGCAVPKVADTVQYQPKTKITYKLDSALEGNQGNPTTQNSYQKDDNLSGRVIKSTCWGFGDNSARITYSWHEMDPNNVKAQVEDHNSERCNMSRIDILGEESDATVYQFNGFFNRNGRYIVEDETKLNELPANIVMILKEGKNSFD